MTKLIALFVVLLAPLAASAGGVSRPARKDPALLWNVYRNAALSASLSLGGKTFPGDRGACIDSAEFVLSVAGGGGAGNTVATVTDGTNTCTFTWPCSTTSVADGKAKLVSATNGVGSGCCYAAGKQVTATITTAGCTTTQPTAMFVQFLGKWN